MRKKIMIVMAMLTLALTFTAVVPSSLWTITAEAHSGRTDANGGHKDNKNKSGLGNYHYHCGGNPAHLHEDGVCPYNSAAAESESKTTDNSKAVTNSNKTEVTAEKNVVTKDTIKKVQEKLNDLDYNCGKADGKMGSKTKEALKKYQKDNDLTADGKITDDLLTKMGITAQ